MLTNLDLPKFNKTRVLVVGDIMLDLYWAGLSQRVSPEAPVPIVQVEQKQVRPGAAANVAVNLASLGCQVSLLGVVGKDQEAQNLTAQLKELSVDCQFDYIAGKRTTSKLRVIAQNQQMIRLDFESDLNESDYDILLKRFKANLLNYDAVIFSDYGKGALQKIPDFISFARKKNIPVLVDPKGTDFNRYKTANILTPNMSEFEAVVGHCNANERTIITKAKQLIAHQELDYLLVTRGKDGMTLISAGDEEPIHFAAEAREVFDVTGAGDTVIAMISIGLVHRMTMKKTLNLATIAAGLVVRKVGTAAVTLSELRQKLRHELNVKPGIVNQQEIIKIINDAKDKGEKIIMTNGCFDILHPGHIAYLKQAKELGDRLIVAVNSDASVARLKGGDRPINPLKTRMALLSALRSVDWVVPFSEDTPQRIIASLLPDCLVKGGDYTANQIAGYAEVTKNGGEVKILPFHAGFSTTNIVENIKKRVTSDICQ